LKYPKLDNVIFLMASALKEAGIYLPFTSMDCTNGVNIIKTEFQIVF
tara:strand:+ start:950 stop:1090 length:141 start_codon:yes stop_codon:yes gene_type:complete